MDERKLINASQLNVIIETAEFAKDFYYFITVHLEGELEKRRTDISERLSNPQFLAKTFFLPLPNNRIELDMKLIFQAYIVTVRDGEPKEKGQARILGTAILDLGPLSPQLTDIKGAGTKQHLKFLNDREGKPVTVGRFLVSLRLIPLMNMPLEGEYVDIFHELPAVDSFREFIWRVRVDFRAAYNVPINSISATGLPSSYMEFGWSHYIQQRPGDNETERGLIVANSKNPMWNYQTFFYNSSTVAELDGFFWVYLKDKIAAENIETICIPVSTTRPFHPVHLEILTTRGGELPDPKCVIYMSLSVEQAVSTTSNLDSLIDIAIKNVVWGNVPTSISRIMIAMTTHGHQLTELPFTQINLVDDSDVARKVGEHQRQRHSVFLSLIMPVKPNNIDNPYEAQSIFTVNRSYINNQIAFYLIVRDENQVGKVKHQMPDTIVAYTEILDDHLKSSLQSNKPVQVPFIWMENSSSNYLIRSLSQTFAELQLSVYNLNKNEDRPPSALNKTVLEPGQGYMSLKRDESYLRTINNNPLVSPYQSIAINNQPAGERWELLSRELQQKQDLIHRLMKENDEKSDALKLTGAEIIDLRRQIKLLQSENSLQRKRLHEEEEIDVGTVVSREIEKMSYEELKMKIIKIAQMYRNERGRNEEFEKVIRQAQDEVSEAYKYKAELDKLREKHETNLRKLQSVQTQVDKVRVYRDTIKKQEAVISKLEKLLDRTLKDTQMARESVQELERLKTENFELQRRIKENAYGGKDMNEQSKQEIRRLERLVQELREQLRSKRPDTRELRAGDEDQDIEKIKLEVDLQKALSRVDAMQDEMDKNAVRFAKEIAHYKGLIAEKQSIIDTMTAGLNY